MVSAPGGISNESEPLAPASGFPRAPVEPFPPIAGGPESGGILRQTATGWSDETRELNPRANPRAATTYPTCPTAWTRSSRCWSRPSAAKAGRSAAR